MISPDRFVARFLRQDPDTVVHILDRMRRRLKRPAYDRAAFRDLLARAGLPRSSRLLPLA